MRKRELDSEFIDRWCTTLSGALPARWGQVLMRRALDYLRLDGYREARLWTLAEYTRGAAFYEATGWSLNGDVRDEGQQLCYSHRLG